MNTTISRSRSSSNRVSALSVKRGMKSRTLSVLFLIGATIAVGWLVATSHLLLLATSSLSEVTKQALSDLAPASAKSFVWKTIPPKKKGSYGVVYSAYSFDTEKSLPRFFQEAATSAKELKRRNPTIPIALITNTDQHVPEVFDMIIKVKDSMLFRTQTTRPDGVFRQWFTRMYYLAHSPFEYTWYVDSHVAFFTTQLEQAFQDFKSSDIDIATANQSPNGFVCHNFAILYRWNDRVQSLFVDWMLRQLDRGIPADDQHPLCEAMGCAGQSYGLKYGMISPKWALAWLSLKWGENNEHWRHRTTQVLEGRPQICHTRDVCEIANKTAYETPRVVYMNSQVGPESSSAFYSQKQISSSGVLPYDYTWKYWATDRQRRSSVVIRKKFKCPDAPPSPVIPNPGQLRSDLDMCRETLIKLPEKNSYGAWTICKSIFSPGLQKSQRPTIISFGIGENMDWERTMIQDFQAIVYAHDPTPKSVAYVQKQQEKYGELLQPRSFVFTQVGLGPHDQDNVTMHLPANPNFVSGRIGEEIKEKGSTRSVQIQVLSLKSTFQKHKLQQVDIVKWDVEGIEFDVLDVLFDDTQNGFGIPARLFLVEWHGRFSKESMFRQQRAREKLEAAGFVKIHTSTENEEVFFNTRFLASITKN